MKPTQKPTLLPTLTLLLTTLQPTQAWGSLGHQTVGFLAQKYSLPQTTTWTQSILSITNTSYLASVASWADTYRYTTAGKFSAGFHYIDANDNPPETCNVEFQRDCHAEEGCIVSAIANYTSRVQDLGLSVEERKIALQFLVHFFGDVAQPLHDEAVAVGGNEINVTFDGVKTNLHRIWDSNIPEKYVGGNRTEDARRWADQLSVMIDDGEYEKDKADWVAGLNLKDAQGSALGMARDANAYVCSYLLKGGEAAVEGADLGGVYYENAVPIVKVQIAKAGYRLAAWLNLLATGETGL